MPKLRSRPRAARLGLSLLLIVRVLALVLGLQLSGTGHLVEDVVSLVSVGHAEHDEQCPADGACSDCPPGCPQCHCPNALRSVAAAATLPLVMLIEGSKTAAPRSDAHSPSLPDLPTPFRPPQAAAAAS